MNHLAEELMHELTCETVLIIPVLGGIEVLESVVVTWVIMAILLIASMLLTRNLKVENISKKQLILETAVVGLQDMIEGIIGEHGKKFVPYLATVLIFLGIANTSALFGFKPPTKDLNVTLGLASVFNMIFIGFFIDIIEKFNIIRTADALIVRILMLGIGILVIGWATYFYLKVNLGAGPRDSLMEGLVKKTDRPVWMIRTFIEGSVLIVGYFLGGPVGIGTLIIALTLGLSIQLAFKIGGYSSESVKHVSLMDLYRDFCPKKECLSEENSKTYLKSSDSEV